MKSAKKKLSGTVVSKSGHKTVSVEIIKQSSHRKYGKKYTHTRKYLVHDENNKAMVGENVTIEECRPISRKKRWTITKKIEIKKIENSQSANSL